MKPLLTIIIPVYNGAELLPKALESVPKAHDYEVLIIDDGSTDGSWAIADRWRQLNKGFFDSITVVRLTENKGVAAAMNAGFALATGKYIVSLSSDDYYMVDFDQFRPHLLDGKYDLIYFDLEVNDKSIWRLTEESKKGLVGAVKFIKRKFLGDTRVPSLKYKEDQPFSQALYDKHPKELFTGIVLKHYNWPREGSLSWQATQDYANDHETWAKNSGKA